MTESDYWRRHRAIVAAERCSVAKSIVAILALSLGFWAAVWYAVTWIL